MSQVTVTTTTAPVTVVCYWAITMTVTLVTTTVDLPALGQHDVHTSMDVTKLGQHDVVLPPQLILRDSMRGSVGLATVSKQQQPQSQMPSQAYANYALGPPQVSFLIQS